MQLGFIVSANPAKCNNAKKNLKTPHLLDSQPDSVSGSHLRQLSASAECQQGFCCCVGPVSASRTTQFHEVASCSKMPCQLRHRLGAPWAIKLSAVTSMPPHASIGQNGSGKRCSYDYTGISMIHPRNLQNSRPLI